MKNLFKQPVVILANGEFPNHETPLGLLSLAGTVICADGSANILRSLNLKPHIIIGDLDSIAKKHSYEGLIVDDSIVVMENIKRRIENGEDNHTAAINGAKQITFVVIATTLVLVSVFLPLSFMGGKTGRLFIEFGVVLSFAVIISSFVALTLTPMMCSKLLKKDENQKRYFLAN